MKLADIIKGYDYSLNGNKDIQNIDINSIVFDSRKCIKGSMFVCIVGYETDGHKYIESALRLGAKVICHCEDLEEYKDDITYIKCENTRNALAYFANRFYSFPSKKLKLIGVSGTNGKTSFCDIANTLFENLGFKTDYIGTLGRKDTKLEGQIIRTTPEITELTKDFSDMVNSNVDYCFLEVSSHGLVLDRVSYLNFYVGVFSNLSMDHLDFHKTMEEYYQAKKKLYYMVDKFSVINIDDDYGHRLYSELKEEKKDVISFGEKEESDYKITIKELSLSKSSFTLTKENNEYDFVINSIGKFNIYNVTPAIIIALEEGIGYEKIKDAILGYHGTNGRIERVEKDIFIDYAHTPDAMEKILKLIKEVSSKKITLVFGCGGNRDHGKRPIMGSLAEKYADNIILTMDNPRKENNKDIINDILKGIENKNDTQIIYDRKEAINKAVRNKKDDEIVLVLGKGHETYQEIGDIKTYFSDREEILNALK
ncbi:UDP-N-acetylmuramoyl-L-alanyl-D-glutamate--2,6-diaminopimelate ligase [Anaerofustis stercorihominis]|uniref:UDP-N-acetylmuramoyl-L-alanyl-D-glutamate--2, 6-diaminopimelate ligase n=1 Tax=Anaerofustis stercorihominis TaxID=214853 RepID=UPI00214C5B32|nr:UDP-N-acetylmuramoyl-L-alanyl-D-glutamate--2,6-diaminopimelate ligase [Anaerofustis stercorihominis]MCR2032798.1 UDP-N-acetylmuramoyl-L-alanyl-D-glutamate--2,6-diaminopimelate ligase [Anaerofustis stercorihominis]